MRTPPLLQDFLALVRQSSGAAQVSLLFQVEPANRQSLLLVHEDECAALPELQDEASAWAWLQQASTNNGDGETAEPVGVFASSADDGVLVRLSLTEILARSQGMRRDHDERRSQPVIVTAPPIDGALWLGLRGGPRNSVAGFAARLRTATLDWLDLPTQLAARLAWSVYQLTSSLQDPVSQLPGRMEFEVFLRRATVASAFAGTNAAAPAAVSTGIQPSVGQGVALLLINPDDFGMINHRFGRAFGDRAVREIAEQLLASVRQTDAVFRYGGAVFGVVLPGASLEQCHAVAEKLRAALTRFAYLDGAVRLSFSMGGVVAEQPDLLDAALAPIEPAALLKRADMALNMAKLGGGARLLIGGVAEGGEYVGRTDPLGGIFTTDTEKDYRNMLLLWDTVGVVSSRPEPAAIASAFVERLAAAFRPNRVGLFGLDEQRNCVLLAGDIRSDGSVTGRAAVSDLKLPDACSQLIAQAMAAGQVQRLRAAVSGSAQDPQAAPGHTGVEPAAAASTAYAVPLMARGEAIGCIFLDAGLSLDAGVSGAGSVGTLQQAADDGTAGTIRSNALARQPLDSSDLIFLNALATQLALALDRATLEARWLQERDSERRQLKVELRELRQALQQAKFVYRSASMHALVDTLRRVAASDATVLIIGESGTGKEVLAHSLHEFSNRRELPFVVVDCGAMAASLLEAELFGHVKGAFTGADRASEGRILQAQGGTLFLDEIGEMPVELQTKLLRFVQEKEFTPVGGNQKRSVDVRIVAATNRRLDAEVAAGRFRADLYYRLQVIAVEAPALRDRLDDVLPLAHYFLEKFSAQHGTGVRRLTAAAEQRLLQHAWPGNVRELQNAMLRAVLMVDGESIDADGIVLAPATDSLPERRDPDAHDHRSLPSAQNVAHAEAPPTVQRPTRLGSAAAVSAGGIELWEQLRVELHRQVEFALTQSASRPVPLGRWLVEDLVVAASALCCDVSRRAARMLGVPESTFRRQLEKARVDRDAGLATRTAHWRSMAPLVAAVLDHAAVEVESAVANDLLEQARVLVLGVVEDAIQDQSNVGAALMGVTLVTYKRWREVRAA